MISVTVYLVLFIITLITLYLKWRYSYWKRAGVLSIEPRFTFENFKRLLDSIHMINTVEELYYLCKKSKSLFGGLYVFASPRAVITDLELIKSVLIKDFNYFHDRGIYHNDEIDPLSGDLFFIEGQKWRTLRSKLTPPFSSGKMKFMFPTIIKSGEELVSTVTRMLETERVIEMKDLIARFTTDVIGSCAFGIECNSLKDPKAEFRAYGRKVFEQPLGGELGFFIRTAFRDISNILKLRNFSKDIENFFMTAVEQTVEFREKNNVRRNDFLDLLIQLKNKGELDSVPNQYTGILTLKEVAAQVFVFFLGGFESSSTTMSFCLHELSMNPSIQEKVVKEVEDVLAKHDGEFTYEAMMECKYLDQVINETLRKYPIFPIIFRTTTSDYKVPNTDKKIDKGTVVFIPVDAIQYDPEYFPNPNVFDPDRFSPEQSHDRHPMTFLPFGDGPRNCIGMLFGQMQIRIGLAYLLKNFRFESTSKKPLKTGFSSLIKQINGGVHLKVTTLK